MTIIDLKLLRLDKVKSHNDEPFINLQQLYEFEFSSVTGYGLNERGLYDQSYLMSHWSKVGVDIYVLYYDRLPIGFVVVNLSSMIDDDQNKRDIAEFFVMPSFRKQGIGEWMAHSIFRKYKFSWEVRQFPNLEAARRFWLCVIDKFTSGHYSELSMDNEKWQGTVQVFQE